MSSVGCEELTELTTLAASLRTYLVQLHTLGVRGLPVAAKEHPALVFVSEGPIKGPAFELLVKMAGALEAEAEKRKLPQVAQKLRLGQKPEVVTCGPSLHVQVLALCPEVLVTLGQHPAQFVLNTSEDLGTLHGRWHTWRGILVLPTYHPEHLIHTPSLKRNAWSDLQKIIDLLRGEK